MTYYETVEPIIRRYETLARNKFGKKFATLVNEQFTDLNKNYFSAVNNPDYGTSLKNLRTYTNTRWHTAILFFPRFAP